MHDYFILAANGFDIPLFCWILAFLPLALMCIGAILTWLEKRKYK